MGGSRSSLGFPGVAWKEGTLRRWLIPVGLVFLVVVLLFVRWLFNFETPDKIQLLLGQTDITASCQNRSLKSKDAASILYKATSVETHQPFYGIDFVPTEDLTVVSSLGAQVIGQVFPHDGNPEAWLNNLDQAKKYNIKVIAWLYPQGWEWNGKSWTIDNQARLFIETVVNHPSLFAVYALEEPYWSGCWGCGYSTYEQQLLYSQIKKIANVPIFSAVDSMSFWTKNGEQTAFADGICDYCATWYYPFQKNEYKRVELIKQLRSDLKVARQRAPNSKIVWFMQSFAQNASGLRMPNSDEMVDLACLVYESGFDGAMWYVWKFNSLYDDYLSNHTELFDTVRKVYTDQVIPKQ